MKAGWREVNLSDVCEFRRGLTYSKRDEVERSTQAVLRATNISLESGALDLSEIRYVSDSLPIPRGKKVLPGTLVVCTASGSKQHLGKAALIENEMDFAFGGFMGLIVPDAQLIPKFLFWLMRSDQYWTFIDGLADGANINNLKFSQLGEFRFCLPPLEEQRRIVAVLDEAFEGLARARENAEANLKSARELFDAALEANVQPLPTWKSRKLADLGIIQTGTTPKTADGDSSGSYIPFVKPGAFQPDGSLNYDLSGLSEDGARGSRIVAKDSVLMVCIGATIGKVGLSNRAVCTNQQINSITPNTGVVAEFLYFQMRSRHFQQAVLHASGQATLPIINKSKWSELSVQVPPTVDEQVAVNAKLRMVLEKVQDLLREGELRLGQIDALRQSLLQKAFAGELT